MTAPSQGAHVVDLPLACRHCGQNLRGTEVGSLCAGCWTTVGTQGLHEGMVIDERPCLQCGYSLKGLAAEGRCPECGTEVVRSLQGNLLVYSAPAFVRRLALGALLVLGGLLMYCLWIGCQLLPAVALGEAAPTRIVIAALCILAGGASLAGWWLVSTPDPGLLGRDGAMGSRRLLRYTLIIAIVTFTVGVVAQVSLGLSVLKLTSGQMASFAGQAFWWAAAVYFVNWPVKTVASLRYTRALALRIPSHLLERRAGGLVRWAIGGTAGLGVIIAAVFLVAGARPAGDWIACMFLPVMCGVVLGILIWWAVYASLIVDLHSSLAAVARLRAESSPATSR